MLKGYPEVTRQRLPIATPPTCKWRWRQQTVASYGGCAGPAIRTLIICNSAARLHLVHSYVEPLGNSAMGHVLRTCQKVAEGHQESRLRKWANLVIA